MKIKADLLHGKKITKIGPAVFNDIAKAEIKITRDKYVCIIKLGGFDMIIDRQITTSHSMYDPGAAVYETWSPEKIELRGTILESSVKKLKRNKK